MLMLVAGVIPHFGESHFAFLGYAKNFRQTPIHRQLDYLRVLGGSKEAAKELKLFGLRNFLTGRFTRLSDRIYKEDVSLSRRRLIVGLIPLSGRHRRILFGLRLRHLAHDCRNAQHRLPNFLTDAIQQASINIQQVFSTLAGIADQALFLTDLLAFFDMQPTIRSKPNALLVPHPFVQGSNSQRLISDIPEAKQGSRRLQFPPDSGKRVALIGENGQGKTTIVKLIARVRSHRGPGQQYPGVLLAPGSITYCSPRRLARVRSAKSTALASTRNSRQHLEGDLALLEKENVKIQAQLAAATTSGARSPRPDQAGSGGLIRPYGTAGGAVRHALRRAGRRRPDACRRHAGARPKVRQVVHADRGWVRVTATTPASARRRAVDV